jgi:hypothetical protein
MRQAAQTKNEVDHGASFKRSPHGCTIAWQRPTSAPRVVQHFELTLHLHYRLRMGLMVLTLEALGFVPDAIRRDLVPLPIPMVIAGTPRNQVHLPISL